MAKTVLALYDSISDARTAAEELKASGFDQNDISLVANASEEEVQGQFDEHGRYKGDVDRAAADDTGAGAATGAGVGAAVGGLGGLLVGLGLLTVPGVGPALAAGPLASTLVGAGAGGVAGGLLGALAQAGVPEDEAQVYAEGVRRGGTILMVRSPDNRADDAASILSNHNAVDLESRAATWRERGWERHDDTVRPMTSDEVANEREESIPVVEEDVRVGKREVERGGVRARTYMSEHPVDEQVSLRDESVNVERKAANRPATESDFQSREVEVTETDEEPVVEKEARVIEDVVIGKQATQTTETVHDTERRTEVEVDDEPLVDEDFARYERTFQGHFRDETDLPNRYNYDDVVPAYRYGWSLANTDRFRDRNWDEVEPEARRAWEERNEGTWDDVREPVRRSWQEARSRNR